MKYAVILVVALALIPTAIDFLTRVEYTVHTSGGVLLTGASTGIGQSAAVYLASQGFRVYATIRKAGDGAQFEAEANIYPVVMDVTNQEQIDRAFDEIVADLDHHKLQLVGLVNNAGISPASKPVEFTDVAKLRQGFEVNVLAVFAVTQKFLPLIRASKGRVITVSSLSGLFVNFMQSGYGSTKFAVEAFSDALRQETRHLGVSVSNINPGYIHTPILGKAQSSMNAPGRDPEQEEALYGKLKKGFLKSGKANSDGYWTTAVTDEAILSALTDQYPKTNYLVAGVDKIPAWMFARIIWLLPKRAFDAVVFAMQG